jgi:hypothetical protein
MLPRWSGKAPFCFHACQPGHMECVAIHRVAASSARIAALIWSGSLGHSKQRRARSGSERLCKRRVSVWLSWRKSLVAKHVSPATTMCQRGCRGFEPHHPLLRDLNAERNLSVPFGGRKCGPDNRFLRTLWSYGPRHEQSHSSYPRESVRQSRRLPLHARLV